LSNLTSDGTKLAVSRPQDRTKLLWAGRTVFDVVLDGSQTGGAIALLEQRGRGGDTTPMHIHRGESEIFYVLEGAITAWAGEDSLELEAGGAVYLPADQAHAFGVRSESARLITITTPAAFAGFVRGAGIPVTGDVPATWEFDVATLMAAAPRHGIEIVGPPPTFPTQASRT
jgi:quercetin dioxygenase-like cupin family protein